LNGQKKVKEYGACEILITSVDREGTNEGFDLELIKKITEAIDIPVIAFGGAKGPEDTVKAIEIAKVDAVVIATIFHYSILNELKNDQNDYKLEENISFLNNGSVPKKLSRAQSVK
jgi:cyclase